MNEDGETVSLANLERVRLYGSSVEWTGEQPTSSATSDTVTTTGRRGDFFGLYKKPTMGNLLTRTTPMYPSVLKLRKGRIQG